MYETQEYYGVRNNSCHSFSIETYNGGETWTVSVTGNEFKEAWLAEAELESELGRCGYQVFYTIEEAEDFLAELDREDSPSSDLQEIYNLTIWGYTHNGLGNDEKTDVLSHAVQYGEEWGGIEFLTRYGIGKGNDIVDTEKFSELARLCQLVQDAYDAEETSEERIERYRRQLSQPCDETPEEKELLDTVERLILSPNECVYYDGTDYSYHKRSWLDVCLVDHDDDNMPCMVVDLGQWVRHDALEAIRSLNERLATV